MRWYRGLFEAGLVIALGVTSSLLYLERTRVRSPFLPRYAFQHDETRGTLFVQGTWTLEEDKLAWPSQTTTIWCELATKRCIDATAVLTGSDSFASLMPVTISEPRVLRWDGDLIVARGQTALCVDTTYNIHLQTSTVTALQNPRNDCGDLPGPPVQRKRMRMVDGHQASMAAHGFTK